MFLNGASMFLVIDHTKKHTNPILSYSLIEFGGVTVTVLWFLKGLVLLSGSGGAGSY